MVGDPMPWQPKKHSPDGKTREQRRAIYDKSRVTDRAFYWSTEWRNFRREYLAVNPLCVDCLPAVRAAVEVHHRLKRRDNPDAAFDRSQMAALCKTCHSKRTARGE